MLRPERAYHQGKSRLVFAGQETLNGYQTMAITHEANAHTSSVLASNPRRIEIRLPDKTVRIMGSGQRGNVLLNDRADVLISLRRDLAMWKELNTDMLLFNPIHATQNLDTRPYLRAGIDVLVDSGGFQLAQGTSDFVDPLTNAAFYNSHASLGVGLDFPAPPWIDAMFYRENCKLQALNNEVIRANLNDGISLVPVVHGSTPFTRLHCLNSVYVAKRDKVICVAGMITKKTDLPQVVMQRVASMCLVLHRTRKDVLYYHFLGATSGLWLSIAALLAQTGYVVSAGGDSVSHRQSAIGGSYNLMPHFQGQDRLTQPLKSQVAAALPCACPVCVHVGDARVLRDFRSSELHHTYVDASRKRSISDTVGSYIAGRITRTDLWTHVLGAQGLAAARVIPDLVFNYLEDVISKGFDKVPMPVPMKGIPTGARSLFGEGSSLSPTKKAVMERVKRIHKTYEAYHKTSLS